MTDGTTGTTKAGPMIKMMRAIASGLQRRFEMILPEYIDLALDDKLTARGITGQESKAPTVLPYQGVWKAGELYSPGSFATHGGSLWHANVATKAQPGRSEAWTLAVKKGRDARDAK